MNKINFSDDYFLLINNTISLLFIWILWNKLAGKCLHTLHNGYLHTILSSWREVGFFLWWGYGEITFLYTLSVKSNDIIVIDQSYKVFMFMRANHKGWITSNFKIPLLLI